MTIKIEAFVDNSAVPFDYGNKLVRETVRGRDRLRVGVSENQQRVVVDLASALTGRCQLLYVLHTTRTGAQLGRYGSPELDLNEIRHFFQRFGRFLSEDARHDIWLHSQDDEATIVLDRHNLIYAYGPMDVFDRVLLDAGLERATVLPIPDPHVHNYHAEWDDHERALLSSMAWTFSPLREADTQWQDEAGAG